jgi:hypothetical protein
LKEQVAMIIENQHMDHHMDEAGASVQFCSFRSADHIPFIVYDLKLFPVLGGHLVPLYPCFRHGR